MAKSKKNRVITTRRLRVPVGHERVELILPKSTCERIGDHILRNEGLTLNDFLKKAIYNALPVHYEVTEDFVFPFGKYQGETAGAVQQFDPSYIDWCKKNIQGFTDRLKCDVPVKVPSTLVNTSGDAPNLSVRAIDVSYIIDTFRSILRPGEKLQLNKNGNAWAHKCHPWGEKFGWRRLGTWTVV